MTIKEIIRQLESIRDYSEDNAKAKDADDIWERDVKALNEAIDILITEMHDECKDCHRLSCAGCKVGG